MRGVLIKVVAAACMLIDHIGMVFFPQNIGFRLIGRLSMPLFAYALASGFYHTTQHDKFAIYFRRMVGFALISQVPYMLIVGNVGGNIGVLWCFSLLFLRSYSKNKKSPSDYIKMAAVALATVIIPMDYGFYGLLIVVSLYSFSVNADRGGALWLGFAAATVVRTALLGFASGAIQLFALPCIPVIDILKKRDIRARHFKWFFYAFYPVHLLVLALIKWLVSP